MKTTMAGSPFLDLAARISDLKEDNYRQLLALSTLIELLVEKGVVTPDEIRLKASELEAEIDSTLEL
ncbi:hypothetical protein COLU111180_16295 [Cohnella lubricantis]|uniref:Nitrile hydratase subunit beta n=1 Tax=Cohnella lubricantis TaxID=2163172 RepID=A0A841TH93_9BACL|nr:hypothetical protein [Cohnella lubricantis]MBB6679515.1 hypothetical protein [Cohnella lubricantis]MBP2119265.1 hypothetical protein [Cohnella lubricantis]